MEIQQIFKCWPCNLYSPNPFISPGNFFFFDRFGFSVVTKQDFYALICIQGQFYSFFPVYVPFFLPLPQCAGWLGFLALYWLRMIRVDILLYSQYEGKALWILPLSIMLMMCFFFLFFFIFFLKMLFIKLRKIPLLPICWVFLKFLNGCCILSFICASVDMNICFFLPWDFLIHPFRSVVLNFQVFRDFSILFLR